MKLRTLAVTVAVLSLWSMSAAQTSRDTADLTLLLQEFLIGASHNDAAMHERFWADDLIYTRSAGVRIDKATLMKSVRSSPPLKPGDTKTLYTGEDIQIHQYGDVAVVAFRLVATTTKGSAIEISNYLNTGTFVKRAGRWQAVAWQSTAVPAALLQKP